ncbi:C40 family peptidase [Arcticibacter sp. MXS-1]|uniref:C40 family peptidase n=1 Tax=Arcticibacter sp. MXS-1 TaxID=3341726 RepID=UPI0035A9141F
MNHKRRRELRYVALIIILLACLSSCKSSKVYTDASSMRGRTVSGSLKERYAALLDVPPSEISNERLYKFIDSWIGVKHQDGGMDKRGTDCSGFTCILQKEVYNRRTARTARQMADQVKRKYEEELQEGDLVFFDFSRKFDHVGIYLKNNRFVHVSTKRGVIISDLKDSWYYKYFSRGGSVKEQ